MINNLNIINTAQNKIPAPDINHIKNFASLIKAPDSCLEMRVFSKQKTEIGFYDCVSSIPLSK